MREGVSTGSCAAAAAKAAALWLVTGRCPAQVDIVTPLGKTLRLDIVPQRLGCCGVLKDAGDDPDATNGLTVYACVEIEERDGAIVFLAGEGVGTVTLPGLKVPPGEAAINPTPRLMIEKALREAVGARKASVTVSVPGGEVVAKRTFNPRLGVVGGISILGTTGIVRPMNEQSVLDSLSLEINTHAVQGRGAVILTFANTGEIALKKAWGFSESSRCVVQTGNRIGFVLDEIRRLGVARVLIGGHPGKLLKVAAGSFDTHNRTADGRMEALCTHAALEGMDLEFIRRLYECMTTENAIALVGEDGSLGGRLWKRLAEAVVRRCVDRSFGETEVAAAFIDNKGTILGESDGVASMVKDLKLKFEKGGHSR